MIQQLLDLLHIPQMRIGVDDLQLWELFFGFSAQPVSYLTIEGD